jgi:hypothetical protein
MTTKRIIYKRPDDGLDIIVPVARGCALNNAAELMLAEFPEDRATITAALAKMPAEMAHDLPSPFPGMSRPIYRPETDEEFVARIAAKDLPSNATYVQIVDSEDLPLDQTFRDAWTTRGTGIETNLPKAREIWRARIRQARVPLLSQLDVEFTRAHGRKDEAAAAMIEVQRQALRDAPADPRIEAAQTPEELKAVWPLFGGVT